ncbi:ABC transporter permease [Pelagibaculum spongiae]|uniref:ABC transporter permease n=1 Tax=Pelagibaculum spongiae TaxID=2080658 RepID=A0A2V1GW10_9GAMM|nr:ABC transporter permease [Pelagibaculum spongiae]PVZ69514.1 ABC transporter permease [Pelagibaculum spongiae]
MRITNILALIGARNKEFYRDRGTLMWNLAFPLLLILGFAFAFGYGGQAMFKVGYIAPDTSNKQAIQPLLDTKYIDFVEYSVDQKASALKKLQHHKMDMLIQSNSQQTQPLQYWVNTSSPKGYTLENIVKGTLAKPAEKQTVEGNEIRYVDWVLPGVLGMNMMFSCLFGVGYSLVRYRKNGVLKRLQATPVRPLEFILAQVVSRMLLVVSVSSVLFIGTWQLLGLTMLGNWLLLFTVLITGAFCLISLALAICARLSSEELAGGLLNLFSWPMMFLSELWFSLEGASPILQQIAQALPLTHIVSSARAIMTEGADLASVAPSLITLIIMTMIFLLIAATSFRWSEQG